MKIVAHAKALRNALRTVKPAVAKRGTIPILACVLFDGPSVTATDLDMRIEARFPVTKASGRAAIAFQPLLQLMLALPADEVITIEAGTAGAARLSSSFGRYDLPTIAADDFPDTHKIDSRPTPMDGDAFLQALRFVAGFVSTEETRYYLNGVCFTRQDSHGDGLVATDGHRLGFHPFGLPHDRLNGSIIPRVAVAALLGLPSPQSVAVTETALRFTAAGVTLSTKLIDGTFPQWTRVVPSAEGRPCLTLNRVEAISALRRLQRFLVERRSFAVVAFDAGNVVLSGKSGFNDAVARERLGKASAARSDRRHIGIRADYAVSILEALRREDTVSAFVDGAGDPVLFRQGEGAGPLAVQMPGRIDEKIALAFLSEVTAEGIREAAE